MALSAVFCHVYVALTPWRWFSRTRRQAHRGGVLEEEPFCNRERREQLHHLAMLLSMVSLPLCLSLCLYVNWRC